MCAIPVILLAVWGTWVLPRHSPNQVVRIAMAAIVGGSICIGIAMFTGNLALFYLGSLAAPYGLLLLLLHVASILANERRDRRRVERTLN